MEQENEQQVVATNHDSTTAGDLSRQAATSRDEYTLTAQEVFERFHAAGLPRTKRSIERYCKEAKLEAVPDPDERRWYVRPASVDALISQMKEINARHGLLAAAPQAGSRRAETHQTPEVLKSQGEERGASSVELLKELIREKDSRITEKDNQIEKLENQYKEADLERREVQSKLTDALSGANLLRGALSALKGGEYVAKLMPTAFAKLIGKVESEIDREPADVRSGNGDVVEETEVEDVGGGEEREAIEEPEPRQWGE